MGWEALPLLVFRVLFRYVDYWTKLQLRQVCSPWMDIVELENGLSVEVYESYEENMEFVESVKITELHIMEWPNPDIKRLLLPSEIEALGLYGTVCPFWFHNIVKNDFRLLKKLILRGKFISHLELERVQKALEINRLEMQNRDDRDMELHFSNLNFEHLENLEIIADATAFPMDDVFFSSKSTYLSPMNQNIMRSVSADIAKNICYLLNNIRSVKLKRVKIYSYQVSVHQDANWKCYPLERFLKFHRESLEELLLPEFSGKNTDMDSEYEDDCIPSNLKALKIYLCCYLTRNRFGGVQNPIYWIRLLLNQSQLETLNLELVSFPENFTTSLMNSVVFKNQDYLKSIELTYIPSEWPFVNGQLFSCCHVLENLKISKHLEKHPNQLDCSTFKNLSLLPSSLKTLELTGFSIDIFTRVSKFPKLSHLVLQVVLVDFSSCYQSNIQMITNFLSLRHLDHFEYFIAKPPESLSLSKIKHFVYKGRLFKEHILSTNYLSTLSVDYGMQILITEEISTIRYAPSICRMHNPESRSCGDSFEFSNEEYEEDEDIVNFVLEEILEDSHLIAVVKNDLGLL